MRWFAGQLPTLLPPRIWYIFCVDCTDDSLGTIPQVGFSTDWGGKNPDVCRKITDWPEWWDMHKEIVEAHIRYLLPWSDYLRTTVLVGTLLGLCCFS